MEKKLSSSLEDYLEMVYVYIKKQNFVKAVDISRSLGVSRASVTEALKKLSEKKLIHYARYDAISLTDEGVKLAKEIIGKHNLLSNFFQYVLGADVDESQEIACKIEHIISKEMTKRISLFTEFYETEVPFDIKSKFKF